MLTEYNLTEADYKKNEFLAEKKAKEGVWKVPANQSDYGKGRDSEEKPPSPSKGSDSGDRASGGRTSSESQSDAAPAAAEAATADDSMMVKETTAMSMTLATTESVPDEEEQEMQDAEEGFVPLNAVGKVNPYDLEKCEDRMAYGVFQLNFTVKLSKEHKVDKKKVLQSGLIEVFSCPSDEKISIVIFSSVSGAKTAKEGKKRRDVSNPMLLTQVYEEILMQGGHCLLAQSYRTQEHLNKRNKPPKLGDE